MDEITTRYDEGTDRVVIIIGGHEHSVLPRQADGLAFMLQADLQDRESLRKHAARNEGRAIPA